MSIDMSQFYQTFFEESFEGLDVMESGLLGLDVGAADAETINTIFRAAHSIKGGSGTFGFTAVADFTHVMETLLDEMRAGDRMVTTESIDLLLKSVDVLREMLEAVQAQSEINAERVATVQKELENLLHGESSAVANETVSEENATDSASTIHGWKILFKPFDYLLKTGNDPVRILNELSLLGEYSVECDMDNLPLFADMDP
ncbi:MAG: Hpt domain-containing protein, partial [Gammaproteobacteria bacterium]|nr:Hpt domain-containing protein [Gammaproteobacteria bacterium]